MIYWRLSMAFVVCVCVHLMYVRVQNPEMETQLLFLNNCSASTNTCGGNISCCGELRERERESNKDSRRKGRIERHTTMQFNMILFLLVLRFELQYLDIWFKMSMLQKQRQRFVVWL